MGERFRKRRPEAVPRHRLRLDRWVLGQWLAIGIMGAGSGAVIGALDWTPFADVGLVLDVLSIGFVVLWTGIYLSALFDWFLILPKVSGISCPGPCERPGRQRWTGITQLWCFHRGCGERCTGVNWYCWRNSLAYSQTADTDDLDGDDTERCVEESSAPD